MNLSVITEIILHQQQQQTRLPSASHPINGIFCFKRENKKPQVFMHQKWTKSHPDTWSEPLSAPRWGCAGPTPESSARQYPMLWTWPPPSPSRTCETESSYWPWTADIGGNAPSARSGRAAPSAAARDPSRTRPTWEWRFDRERWNGPIWGQTRGCWGQVPLAGGAQSPASPCSVFLQMIKIKYASC